MGKDKMQPAKILVVDNIVDDRKIAATHLAELTLRDIGQSSHLGEMV